MTKTIAGFEIHPIANLFPLIEGEAFEDLVADMREHGQRRPIVLYKDQVIDGRNRLRACEALGIEPLLEDLDEGMDPLAWVMSENLHRRHLTTSQRAMVAARYLEEEQKRARERMAEAPRRAQPKPEGEGQANLPDLGQARDHAAKKLAVSGRTVQHAAAVLASACEALIKAVESDRIAVSAAATLAKAHSPAEIEALLEGEPEAVDIALAKARAPTRKAAQRVDAALAANPAEDHDVDSNAVDKREGSAQAAEDLSTPFDDPAPEIIPSPQPADEPPPPQGQKQPDDLDGELEHDLEREEGEPEAEEQPADDLAADAAKLDKGLTILWRMLCGPRWQAKDDGTVARAVRSMVRAGLLKSGKRIEAEAVARLAVIVNSVLLEEELGRSMRRVTLVNVPSDLGGAE